MGAEVACISYDCHREFTSKARINMKIEVKVTSAYRSNLGPIGIIMCSLILGACEFEHRFIACKHVLCPVILGLDFAQDF